MNGLTFGKKPRILAEKCDARPDTINILKKVLAYQLIEPNWYSV